MRRFPVLIFLSFCLLLPGSLAQATGAGSIIVYGSRDSHDCFVGANMAHLSAESGLPACNNALSYQKMSRKERAATLVNRGILLTHLREFDAALDDFDKALKLSAGFAEAYLNRGNVFLFIDRFDLALADYDAAIKGESRKLHAAYYNRGLVREALKKPKLAYQDFLRAAELRPSWPLATLRIERYAGMGYE